MSDYTLSLEDVQTYLNSKQDIDVIGVTCHPFECLLVEAARLKYPGVLVKVGIQYVHFDEEKMQLTPELQVVRRQFDELGQMKPVTKQQWLHSQGGK